MTTPTTTVGPDDRVSDGFIPKHFDPTRGGRVVDPASGAVAFGSGAAVHVYDPRLVLAVNVALSTRRPLLVSGEPGVGKSTLAASVAAVLGRRYYKHTVTSRTQARDLEWHFDAIRRLGDAQAGKGGALPAAFYVEPQALWWAFDPKSARTRGLAELALAPDALAVDPSLGGDADAAVVLVDEIDKADPDVPNDLLEPLDAGEFKVHDTGLVVKREDRDVLLVLTTNAERQLPPAFLRRCVDLRLDPPTVEWLVRIAHARYPDGDDALFRRVAERVMTLHDEATRLDLRAPSTAEYLDALHVCRDFRVDTSSLRWKELEQALLWKHERQRGAHADR